MNLSIEQLNFQYKNSRERIFEKFALSVQEGQILAILGKSGSGKSTLLRIIAGLEENAEGIIRIGDKLVQSRNIFVPVEKRKVGFVFQDYALFPFMTVSQNIAFGMKVKDKRKLESLFSLVQLEGLEKRYPHELSGGQQQRTALARALAGEPDLLLMDEPFSNLDSTLVMDLREDLKTIIKSQRMTTLLVTHDPEDASALADRTLML
ncbi:MAG: ATP-binding cassette domain-containing protein [Acidaminobacter sp.]|uniref:ABC transporter ATP-binding protein n=1 Tax=Acidaminobacter sp. TaxID=1872102 RepID=UPI00138611B0|nr:ABC transporter ATP-binding protein [Acidaminobacter sp.]MZQ98984.1 ATP-binding cassette domain-containing protein [Acidaminobacter sp.]